MSGEIIFVKWGSKWNTFYILLIGNVSWSYHEACILGTINTKYKWGCKEKTEAAAQWEIELLRLPVVRHLRLPAILHHSSADPLSLPLLVLRCSCTLPSSAFLDFESLLPVHGRHAHCLIFSVSTPTPTIILEVFTAHTLLSPSLSGHNPPTSSDLPLSVADTTLRALHWNLSFSGTIRQSMQTTHSDLSLAFHQGTLLKYPAFPHLFTLSTASNLLHYVILLWLLYASLISSTNSWAIIIITSLNIC